MTETIPSILNRLKRKDLLESRALIGTCWIESAHSVESFDVFNPSNQMRLATLPDVSREETAQAIEAAKIAQVLWAQQSGKDRSQILRRWHDLMVKNVNDLATILTAEMGKPLAEAKGEVLYGAGYIEWFAEEAKRIYDDLIPGHQPDKRIMVQSGPLVSSGRSLHGISRMP